MLWLKIGLAAGVSYILGKPISIVKSFKEKHILLTGSTGFIGKVFLALLLQYVPTVNKISLLIRKKRSKSAAQRVREMLNESPVFQNLRFKYGQQFEKEVMAKLQVIEGDLCHENLDINNAQVYDLNFDLLINFAGLVDFNPDLGSALLSNTLAIENLVAFVKKYAPQEGLLHASTCYVAGATDSPVAEESICEASPAEYSFDVMKEVSYLKNMLGLTGCPINSLDDKFGEERAKYFGWPNIYTYTKALGEGILANRGTDISWAIVRPSIVEGALDYPFEGWNEGYNTMAPISYAIGQIKYIPAQANIPLDIIPVDLVAKGIILVAAEMMISKTKLKKIYQLGTSRVNPISFKSAAEMVNDYFENNRSNFSLRFKKGIKCVKLWHPLTPANKRKGLSMAANLLSLIPVNEANEIARTIMSDCKKAYNVEAIIDVYLPFIYWNRCTFKSQNIEDHEVQEPELKYSPKKINWDNYFKNVQMPGMDRWFYSKMDRKRRKF